MNKPQDSTRSSRQGLPAYKQITMCRKSLLVRHARVYQVANDDDGGVG